MSELFYVKYPNQDRYHEGPGRRFTPDVYHAALYPRKVAERIADIYGGIVIRAEAHLQTLIGHYKKQIKSLEELQQEIESGRRTYVKVPVPLVSFFDQRDEVERLPESSLKAHLLKIIEDYKAHGSCLGESDPAAGAAGS